MLAYIPPRNVVYSLKNVSETLTDFTKAIELGYKRSGVYSDRGKAYKALGKTKEAKALEK